MSHLASDCLARLKMPSSAVLNFVSGARSNRFAVYCAYSSVERCKDHQHILVSSTCSYLDFSMPSAFEQLPLCETLNTEALEKIAEHARYEAGFGNRFAVSNHLLKKRTQIRAVTVVTLSNVTNLLP